MQSEDAPFQHYSLKHRITSWVSLMLFDHVTYTVRRGLLKGMKRKGGLGWIPTSGLRLEEEFWNGLDLSGMVVYDVGAFHGLLTLFFACRAGTVVSYEPNTRNRMRLAENIALNCCENIRVRPVGLGSVRERRQMASDPLMMGGSNMNPKEVPNASLFEDIPVTTIDDEVFSGGIPAPNFIKIDTEGWELEVLRGALRTIQEFRPTLFLEMHGATIREKKRKVADIQLFLSQAGYRDIRHVETGTQITHENTATGMEGHLYCLPSQPR